MATVQKGSKLNFYKFVKVKEPSASGASASDQSLHLTKAININTTAINGIGATLNSFAKVVSDIKKVQLAQLDAQQRGRVKFEAQYTKPKKEKLAGAFVGGLLKKGGGFLEGLLEMLSGIFKAAVVIPALQWLADPNNKETIETGLNILKTVVQFIFDFAKFGITNTIDGLYNLLKDDATWQDRLLGLGQAIVGIGTIVLGVRYLKNPTKIISDIYGGVRALIGFVTGGGRRRGGNVPGGGGKRNRFGGAARFLLGTGITIGTGYALNQAMNQPEPEPEEKAQGGKIKKAAQGGWISGPQSGYKVSLDGGRSTSFIGHGTEYVARKSNGGAFVVPFNTPGTKTQPHLTQKRIGEAKSQGYKLPGFSQGGAFLEEIKKRDATQGSNANKKIYLHWSAGPKNSTALNGKLGYQAYVKTNGIHMHSKYGQTPPYHTYKKNGSNAAGIGIAGGSGITRERQAAWTSPHAPEMSQYKRMAKEAAGLATIWGWKPSDITDKRVRTHSEEYRDNKAAYGDHFRWDLEKLFGQDPLGSGPNKIRGMIKQEMSKFGQKNLNQPDAHDDSTMPKSGWNPLLGIADALTGNVFNFDGVPKNQTSSSSTSGGGGNRDGSGGDEQQSSHNAHGFGALLDMIGKHESDSSGGYDAVNQIGTLGGHGVEGYAGPFSKMKQHGGKKLTTMTVGEVMALQAPRPGMSDAEWIRQGRLHATGRYQIIGPTLAGLVSRGVVKKSDKYNEATQNKLGVALIKGRGRNARALKSEWIGLKHETAGAILAAWDANGAKTKGGHSAASGSSGSGDVTFGYGANGSGASSSSEAITRPNTLMEFTMGPRKPPTKIEEKYHSGGITGHNNYSEIKRTTEERNRARTAINEKTQAMVSTALEAVKLSNGANAQVISQAQTALQAALSASQAQASRPPTVVGSGGGSTMGSMAANIAGTAVRALGSKINPLQGIFK